MLAVAMLFTPFVDAKIKNHMFVIGVIIYSWSPRPDPLRPGKFGGRAFPVLQLIAGNYFVARRAGDRERDGR
jgi:hypothetical protein